MQIWVLCIVILFGRILDMSLATIRTVMIVRGKNLVAALIGFTEIFVWFMIVREALNTETSNIFVTLAYASGFALGTYLGGLIVKIFSREKVTLQVVTNQNQEMIDTLKEKGYGVTFVEAQGANSTDKKYLLYIEADSKFSKDIRNIIKEFDEKAFITVHEAKHVYNGFFKKK